MLTKGYAAITLQDFAAKLKIYMELHQQCL